MALLVPHVQDQASLEMMITLLALLLVLGLPWVETNLLCLEDKVSSGPEPPGLGGGLECLCRHRVAMPQVGPGSCSPENSGGKTALGGWSACLNT